MSAGVCGKRLGFEEIFGSSTPTSSAKRARCSSFGSPIRSADFGFGSEDKVSLLLRMFPSMDREVVRAEIFFVLSFLVVETVLNTHNHNIEDAIESLHALCLGSISAKNEAQNLDPMVIANCPTGFRSAHPGNESCQISEQETENLEDNNSTCEGKNAASGTAWIDIFVQEMMNATDLDDARGRAATILEAFERNVVAQARTLEEEIASLRENLQSLLKDNQILKRAVAIQHERNLEQEEKVREVQQLKNLISQYQEQVRTLELNNYTLKLHLQRAQESSSIPGHFHPDVF
ncbi:PREDICTED: uncharacterized protein LOC104594581 isoform X2 [Nelumbo nucifera]|uniref:Uncharacterized protein LOC104594581 isoform X2 n=1 Tax=Nelumbo nucifera TaxID=4432 RepID=A0A1U7ZNA2_NELNU|nr:PREDICTED: uncharacterized protein LOC104594581 isoform X2 [Nelumbo nucifera]